MPKPLPQKAVRRPQDGAPQASERTVIPPLSQEEVERRKRDIRKKTTEEEDLREGVKFWSIQLAKKTMEDDLFTRDSMERDLERIEIEKNLEAKIDSLYNAIRFRLAKSRLPSNPRLYKIFQEKFKSPFDASEWAKVEFSDPDEAGGAIYAHNPFLQEIAPFSQKAGDKKEVSPKKRKRRTWLNVLEEEGYDLLARANEIEQAAPWSVKGQGPKAPKRKKDQLYAEVKECLRKAKFRAPAVETVRRNVSELRSMAKTARKKKN